MLFAVSAHCWISWELIKLSICGIIPLLIFCGWLKQSSVCLLRTTFCWKNYLYKYHVIRYGLSYVTHNLIPCLYTLVTVCIYLVTKSSEAGMSVQSTMYCLSEVYIRQQHTVCTQCSGKKQGGYASWAFKLDCISVLNCTFDSELVVSGISKGFCALINVEPIIFKLHKKNPITEQIYQNLVCLMSCCFFIPLFGFSVCDRTRPSVKLIKDEREMKEEIVGGGRCWQRGLDGWTDREVVLYQHCLTWREGTERWKDEMGEGNEVKGKKSRLLFFPHQCTYRNTCTKNTPFCFYSVFLLALP